MKKGFLLSGFFYVSLRLLSDKLCAAGLLPLTPELVAEFERKLDWNYLAPLQRDLETLGKAREILKTYEHRGESSEHPSLVLTAGSMAGGKTTILNEVIRLLSERAKSLLVLDPDDAKDLFVEWDKEMRGASHRSHSDFHLASIYILDMLLAWALKSSVSAVFVSSLRHQPSAEKLIRDMREKYPHYLLGLLDIRAPLSTLAVRNKIRSLKTGRIVPTELLLKAAEEVQASVRALSPHFDTVLTVTNDQDRPPRVPFIRWCGSDIQTGILLQELALKNSAHPLAGFVAAGACPIKQKLETRMRHWILDLDWTLAYALHPEQSHLEVDGPIFEFEGIRHRASDGLIEFLTVLLRNPKRSLSLFSGGKRIRNEDFLRSLLLPTMNGEAPNAFERFFSILSADDLIKLERENEKDPKKLLRKNIQLIRPDHSPDDIGIVEDLVEGVLENQRVQAISLAPTYNFYREWNSSRHVGLPYDPPHERAFALERNKLAYALGVILEAEELATRLQISLRESLFRLTFDGHGHRIAREDPRSLRFYERGIVAMSEVNPEWQKIAMPMTPVDEAGCKNLVTALVSERWVQSPKQ